MCRHYPLPGYCRYLLHSLWLSAIIISLAACTSLTLYQPPAQGPVASLTIETTAPHRNIRVVSYTGLQNAESEGSLITILNPADTADGSGKTITINIAAEQPFRFSTTISDTISYAGKVVTSILCKTHSRFIPQAGAKYLARHASLAGSDCKMEVYRLGANNDKQPERTLEDLAWCIDPKLDDPAYLEKYPEKVCR